MFQITGTGLSQEFSVFLVIPLMCGTFVTSHDLPGFHTLALFHSIFAAGSDGKAALIAAADKGLYHSKESGRNKLSIVNMAV